MDDMVGRFVIDNEDGSVWLVAGSAEDKYILEAAGAREMRVQSMTTFGERYMDGAP